MFKFPARNISINLAAFPEAALLSICRQLRVSYQQPLSKPNTYLFCNQSVLISVKRIARVSRVTSRSNCFLAAVSSVVALVDPFSVPVPKFAKPPVALSSLTAQSTKGSYTKASRSVNRVSRPRFNDFRTCSALKRNVPWKGNWN